MFHLHIPVPKFPNQCVYAYVYVHSHYYMIRGDAHALSFLACVSLAVRSQTVGQLMIFIHWQRSMGKSESESKQNALHFNRFSALL